MSSGCAFRDGVLHDHGNDRCHEATRRAGAVEALRAVAAELTADVVCSCQACASYADAARRVVERADLIARGVA